jgi:phosphoribosylformimino-5-aminoimidazole carboxamide ribotide isomerase
MLLIPAIDLRAGRCVRLLQGRFDAETVYSADPASVLGDYRALGARRVHVVDLDGARGDAATNREVIEALAAGREPSLQVGGGIRSSAALGALLALGVERAVVGSVAVTDPPLVMQWFDAHGTDRLVLALDVHIDADGVPRLRTHGWERQSSVSLWQAIEGYLECGLRHVLCTDVERDGALSGPNLDLYTEAVRRFPQLDWQASGGVRDVGDLTALADTGVAAVISGRALLEGRMQATELEPFLQSE